MRKRGSESSELLDGKAVGNLQTTKPRELGQGPERTVIDPDITAGEMTELTEPAKRCDTRERSGGRRSRRHEQERAYVMERSPDALPSPRRVTSDGASERPPRALPPSVTR